jgi:hypothetical protein
MTTSKTISSESPEGVAAQAPIPASDSRTLRRRFTTAVKSIKKSIKARHFARSSSDFSASPTSTTVSDAAPTATTSLPSCALARSAFAWDRLAERVKKAAPQLRPAVLFRSVTTRVAPSRPSIPKWWRSESDIIGRVLPVTARPASQPAYPAAPVTSTADYAMLALFCLLVRPTVPALLLLFALAAGHLESAALLNTAVERRLSAARLGKWQARVAVRFWTSGPLIAGGRYLVGRAAAAVMRKADAVLAATWTSGAAAPPPLPSRWFGRAAAAPAPARFAKADGIALAIVAAFASVHALSLLSLSALAALALAALCVAPTVAPLLTRDHALRVAGALDWQLALALRVFTMRGAMAGHAYLARRTVRAMGNRVRKAFVSARVAGLVARTREAVLGT